MRDDLEIKKLYKRTQNRNRLKTSEDNCGGVGVGDGVGNGNPSNILAWKIPRTEEPVRLQSMGSQD